METVTDFIFLASKITVDAKCNHEIIRFSLLGRKAVTNLCVRLVTQSCPTLCNPMDCSPPGSSVHGDSPGKRTGVDGHALLQGIFPTQGLNPGLLHCRQTLYHLSYQRSPSPYMTTGKTIALTKQTFVGKVMPAFSYHCLGWSELFFQGASVFYFHGCSHHLQ